MQPNAPFTVLLRTAVPELQMNFSTDGLWPHTSAGSARIFDMMCKCKCMFAFSSSAAHLTQLFLSLLVLYTPRLVPSAPTRTLPNHLEPHPPQIPGAARPVRPQSQNLASQYIMSAITFSAFRQENEKNMQLSHATFMIGLLARSTFTLCQESVTSHVLSFRAESETTVSSG